MTKRKTAAQRRTELRQARLASVRERSLAARKMDPKMVGEISRPEVGLVVRRVERGGLEVRYSTSVGDDYLTLMGLTHARAVLAGIEDGAVRELRDAGVSWEEIGAALGVSGEAARKRLRDQVESDD